MGVPFEVAERMKDSLGFRNYTALARDLGVTPQALSNYKKRGEIPSALVIGFAARHSLSVDGLLTGQAETRASSLTLADIIIESDINPDEMVYLGKALKVLRSLDTTKSFAFRYSLDALLAAPGRELADV